MTQEDYCSFEVSKLLKEKGFDVELQCYSYDAVTKGTVDIFWQKNINRLLPRCTHQMAMRWLREINIVIEIRLYNELYPFEYESKIVVKNEDDNYCRHQLFGVFDTYEEAVEAALKYSLEKLI